MLKLKLTLINYSWTHPRGKKKITHCFCSHRPPASAPLWPRARFSLIVSWCQLFCIYLVLRYWDAGLVCSIINWNDCSFYLWLWSCDSLKSPREKLFRSVWSDCTGFTYFSFAYVRLLSKTIWSRLLVWRSGGQAPASSNCHCRTPEQGP